MPICREWGLPSMTWLLDGIPPMDHSIEMIWLSGAEKKFYTVKQELTIEILDELMATADVITGKLIYNQMVIGTSPYGGLSIWIYGVKKSRLIRWEHAKETQIDMQDILPLNSSVTVEELCCSFVNNNQYDDWGHNNNRLPPRDLFDRYMQQFSYRYVVEFGHWDEENEGWKPYEEDEVKPELDYIEEALYDGTHDKLHDGGLMDYHQAGKPKKQALQWHIKKSEYTAYLWFDDMKIRAAFEAFYHDYPEAEMDFSFRIDPQKNKYQILFNCRDAEQPIPLNESAYQMIVFKSKFEYYRSNNYSQPRGAWIW